MPELAQKNDEELGVIKGVKGRGGRGRRGRGRGGVGREGHGRGDAVDSIIHERGADGLYPPLGLPIKHRAVDGLCYAPQARNVIQSFPILEDDVLVATYPRSGTTWTLEIVRNIHLVQRPELSEDHPLRYQDHRTSAPWINLIPAESALRDHASPRILKTHNHYQHLHVPLENKTAKIIYTMRDPKDVVCSLYHHCLRAHHVFGYSGTFDEFVIHFINGHVESDSYWKLNKGYLENKHNFNILYLKYEDLKTNPEGSIEEVNKFLGYPPMESAKLTIVKQKTSFESMNGTQITISGNNVKGNIGTHKEMLSQEQMELIDQKTKEMLPFESISDYIQNTHDSA